MQRSQTKKDCMKALISLANHTKRSFDRNEMDLKSLQSVQSDLFKLNQMLTSRDGLRKLPLNTKAVDYKLELSEFYLRDKELEGMTLKDICHDLEKEARYLIIKRLKSSNSGNGTTGTMKKKNKQSLLQFTRHLNAFYKALDEKRVNSHKIDLMFDRNALAAKVSGQEAEERLSEMEKALTRRLSDVEHGFSQKVDVQQQRLQKNIGNIKTWLHETEEKLLTNIDMAHTTSVRSSDGLLTEAYVMKERLAQSQECLLSRMDTVSSKLRQSEHDLLSRIDTLNKSKLAETEEDTKIDSIKEQLSQTEDGLLSKIDSVNQSMTTSLSESLTKAEEGLLSKIESTNKNLINTEKCLLSNIDTFSKSLTKSKSKLASKVVDATRNIDLLDDGLSQFEHRLNKIHRKVDTAENTLTLMQCQIGNVEYSIQSIHDLLSEMFSASKVTRERFWNQ